QYVPQQQQQQPMSGQYQQQQYVPQQQPMMQGQPMQAYGQQEMMQQVAKGSRSKIVTFLLAFFLGYFGVHNFYLGKTGLGITQLLLTVLTFGIGVLITVPWSFIEGILALASSNFRDGDGLPLSN
ncbi:MAG: TM2 domain-containing protein, partial [Euryarchaeota archaeon]